MGRFILDKHVNLQKNDLERMEMDIEDVDIFITLLSVMDGIILSMKY